MKIAQENIVKAADTAVLLVSDLEEANKTASPLLSIVLLDLIERAAKINAELSHLANIEAE